MTVQSSGECERLQKVSLLPAPQCHPRRPGASVPQPCPHSRVSVPCGSGIVVFLPHPRPFLTRKRDETGHRALLSLLFHISPRAAKRVPTVLTRDDGLVKAWPAPRSPSARFPGCPWPMCLRCSCRAWALASSPAPALRDAAQGLGVRLASPLPSTHSRGRERPAGPGPTNHQLEGTEETPTAPSEFSDDLEIVRTQQGKTG